MLFRHLNHPPSRPHRFRCLNIFSGLLVLKSPPNYLILIWYPAVSRRPLKAVLSSSNIFVIVLV
jgi:hypothetical protein